MSSSPTLTSKVVSGKVLRRFADRVAQSLDRRPVDLSPEAHRARLAELLAETGSANHYELLAIGSGADEREIHAAYEALARQVHPRHARALGLRGREAALEILFERATQAYLVLTDPERRAAYDREAAVERRVGPGQRAREASALAADLYEQAGEHMEADDFHFAIELLRQAVRKDRTKAAYWHLLGRAQARNPRWLHMATDSYREAVRLTPEDPAIRSELAALLEERGERDEAKAQYREVVERHPDHGAAVDGLNRLESEDRQGQRKRRFGFFRR